VLNCKSLLVTEAERKPVRRQARFKRDENYHLVFFFCCKARCRRKFTPFWKKTIRRTCAIVCHHKNWVSQFKRGDFSTCDAPLPGWPKTVTNPEIIDQIHELILEDHRISAKSIAEKLRISRERVGSIIHEDLDMRKLREVGPEMPEIESKTSTVPVFWTNSGIFSARSKWFPVAIGDHGRNLAISLWPGDKATINGMAA